MKTITKWLKKSAHLNHLFCEKKNSQVGPLIACSTVGQPVWTPRRYDALSEEGYMRNVIVYRCVTLIARSAASVPWQLSNPKKKQILSTHPLLDLLHHPNPRQGGAGFIESVLSYKLLSGNCYIEAVKNPKTAQPIELYTLRPDRMKIIPGAGGVPIAYEYGVNGQKRRIPVNPVDGSASVLHLKTFHPLNDWYGMSPIEAAASAIDQHNAVSSHNLALLQNGGRPSGALKISPNRGAFGINEQQRQQLRENLREAYSGSLNAGRLLILEGDIEWQEMGMKLKDLDFVAGKQMSAREIAQAYGVPSMLVGVPGDSTFSNYREARFHLWEDTILPLLDHLCDEFNHWLTPQFSNQLRLEFNLDSIPAMSLRRENTWKRISQASFLTLNEKRELLGFPALDKDIMPSHATNQEEGTMEKDVHDDCSS